MVLPWIVTLPATIAMAFVALTLTQLPGAFAWVATGLVVAVAGTLIVVAMSRAMTADDVEAEIPVDDDVPRGGRGAASAHGTRPGSPPVAGRTTSARGVVALVEGRRR